MQIARAQPWLVLSVGIGALFAGLAALGFLGLEEASLVDKSAAVKSAPIWLLFGLALLVPLAEAAVWTAAPVELGAKLARSPVTGGLVGVIAYGPVYHHAGGTLAVAASCWVALVICVVYLYTRLSSRLVAFAQAVALRWCFVAFALFALHMS